MMAMEWKISEQPVDYPQALAAMETRVAALIEGKAAEQVWLLEHPPLYTAGTSAKAQDLLQAQRFPVYAAGRGGQYTYHGPGQRIAYVMRDLARYDRDVRRHVWRLEEWLIRCLQALDVQAERREGRVGLWVVQPDGSEAKIAAIGVRVRRWVTYHGVALNIDPDLGHFQGIVPCGLAGFGVTSLAAMGKLTPTAQIDALLQDNFTAVFGNDG